jgi:hypothetical protein
MLRHQQCISLFTSGSASNLAATYDFRTVIRMFIIDVLVIYSGQLKNWQQIEISRHLPSCTSR